MNHRKKERYQWVAALFTPAVIFIAIAIAAILLVHFAGFEPYEVIKLVSILVG